MEIFSLGHSCFKLRGKNATAVIDNVKNSVSVKDDEPFVVDGPGEYEIAGVNILGISLGENTAYKIGIDELAICCLGDSGNKLTDEQRDRLGTIDILLTATAGIVTKLESKIVIPVMAEKLDREKFLQEMGAENIPVQAKLSVTAGKLPENTTIVILE